VRLQCALILPRDGIGQCYTVLVGEHKPMHLCTHHDTTAVWRMWQQPVDQIAHGSHHRLWIDLAMCGWQTFNEVREGQALRVAQARVFEIEHRALQECGAQVNADEGSCGGHLCITHSTLTLTPR
jgi:hypothetical protein